MKLKLTDLTIKSLPTPKQGQADYYDLAYPGLCLRTSQGGSKVFTFIHRKDNTRKRITLGTYGQITLAQAREMARSIEIQPVVGSLTFGEAVQAYLSAETGKMSKSHGKEVTRILCVTFAHLHVLALSSVSTKHVTDIIDGLVPKTPGQANHVHTRIKTFFRWAKMRNLITVNPIEFLPSPSKTQDRDRILSDTELHAIWHACPQLGTFGLIVQTLIGTGCRRGEITSLRKEWIQGDVIVFPRETMKAKNEHILPVGALTTSLLLPQMERYSSGLLFPVPNMPETLFSAWSKSKAKLDISAKVSDYTIYDLRRTFRSNLSRWRCCSSEIAEMLIAHQVGSKIRRTYDRYDYLDEKREAVRCYETHLKRVLQIP